MKSRGKPVSSEDDALFRTALSDTKPIKKRERHPPDPPKRARIVAPVPRILNEPVYNDTPAPAIGGHADAHLRRGRLEPDSRIDLHGLTQDGAYRVLTGFLSRAQAGGQKLVLVITGKGGVLRKALPLWLGERDMRALVAGVNEAHVKHGGAGAFYVLLRRPKNLR
ncbi:MAG TPA: Smr/MutS family protein [Micropepsaceae bacterium]|jgi:DNA-nicking Smr family endonuclease|nr:Smr/MutS family protein [Micropepsaceae bacterium]